MLLRQYAIDITEVELNFLYKKDRRKMLLI